MHFPTKDDCKMGKVSGLDKRRSSSWKSFQFFLKNSMIQFRSNFATSLLRNLMSSEHRPCACWASWITAYWVRDLSFSNASPKCSLLRSFAKFEGMLSRNDLCVTEKWQIRRLDQRNGCPAMQRAENDSCRLRKSFANSKFPETLNLTSFPIQI